MVMNVIVISVEGDREKVRYSIQDLMLFPSYYSVDLFLFLLFNFLLTPNIIAFV